MTNQGLFTTHTCQESLIMTSYNSCEFLTNMFSQQFFHFCRYGCEKNTDEKMRMGMQAGGGINVIKILFAVVKYYLNEFHTIAKYI